MVYTNLTATVNFKTHANCDNTLFFDNTKVSEELVITGIVTDFSDDGFDKKIDYISVGDGLIIHQIKKPLKYTFDFNILGTSTPDSDSLQTVLLQLSDDYEISTDLTVASFEDTKKKHRIAFIWTDSETSTEYMKVFYNAFLEKVIIKDSEALEFTISMSCAFNDIETGSGNIYTYEGSGASTALATIDGYMNWS